MKTTKHLLALGLFLLATSLGAQTNWPGYIDTSFTATCISNANFNNTVKAMIVQGDGKIVGVGGFANFYPNTNVTCENGIFRCNSNGTPDGTFHSPFTLLPNFQSVLATGSKYVVGGSVYLNNKQYTVARLNSNGSLDTSFSLTQTNAGSASVTGLGVDTLNRIVIAGWDFLSTNAFFVRRLNSNGTVDVTFSAPSLASWAGLSTAALAVQPDRKIIIGGLFTNVAGVSRVAIARLNENGSLDSSFTSPFVGYSSIACIKLLTNGQMLVTGQFGTNANPNLVLCRLNDNGTVDSTFRPTTVNDLGLYSGGTAIALQTDGRVIFTHGNGATRLSANGTIDANYGHGAGGDPLAGSFKCVAVDASGRALVGAETACAVLCSGPTAVTRRGLIRLFGGDAPVPTPPTIDVQPADQYAFAGGSATFNVGVSGTQPLIYNWYFGGANVGGSATVQFGPPLILGYDNTSIYCIITNQYGRATSSVVTLHVSPAPIAPTITTNPVSATVSNPAPITAAVLTEANLRGKILHLHILNGATPFPATGDYDLVLAAAGNTYSIPAGGAMAASSGNWTFGPDLGIDAVLTLDNSFPGGGPVKVALLTDGTYEMYADGVVNNQNGTYSIFNSDGTPLGPTVTFTAAATGTAPITFTWLFGGTPLAPAAPDVFPTSAIAPAPAVTTLTLNNVTTLNAGGYSVVVSNAAGSVTSIVATLKVNGYSGGLTDSAKPFLAITAPPSKVKTIGSNQVNFAGTARDNIALAAVQVSVNGGSFVAAAGLSNWTANVPLAPGTNTIRVRAADLLGNAVTNTRVLVYIPALPLAGVYNGLFYDTNTPAHVSAGGFALTLKTNGTFTGNVKMGAALYPFSGGFGLSLTANTTVPRTNGPTLTLALRLVNGRLEGDVSDGVSWTSFLLAYKAGPVGALAGKYTLLLPGSVDPTNAPGGDSTTPLTLTAKSKLSGLGTMGDGTSLKVSTTVAPGGQAPIYNPLYSGAGSLFGWLTFADTADHDVVGTLYWSKPGSVAGAYYPTGFFTSLLAAGSRFIAPLKNTPALTLSNGVVILAGGNLTNTITIPVTLGGNNKITGTNGLAITISTLKGSVSGSFVDPATGAKRIIKGVILRDQNFGGGEFLGADQSGSVTIGNAP